jgi:O-succinylbenzoic acid--CoA ligase
MTPTIGAFPDWLRHRANTTPDRIALIAGARTWTFAAVDAEASRLARQLAHAGTRPGDRVATLLSNGPIAAMLPHTALRLGATLVPLNTRSSATEIAWLVADASPRVVIVDARTASLVAALRGGGETPSSDTAAQSRGSQDWQDLIVLDAGNDAGAGTGMQTLAALPEADADLRHRHDASHVATLMYTSGTTDHPKGAMLTVANHWWSAIGSALNLGVRDDDRWLLCLPLFHVGGLSIVYRSAIYGTAAIVHDGFDPAAVNRAIDDDGVTIISVVAVMLQRMLDARGNQPYPPTLRCVLLGGGPAPKPLLERCAMLGIPVVQTYGLTETTSQVATLAPDDALARLGSAGRPLYPNELRIAPVDRVDAALDADVEGEIVVRGPVVMAGYANRADATARAIVDGWLHTGDIGRIDADGYLYVLDRRDDLIITGGENVYPAEVEAVLLGHPSVAEAGVVGAPDSEWGQRVVAVVRLGSAAVPGDAAETLRAHCRSRLGAYKVPREVLIVSDPLPRTASGKLQRAVLRQRIA